MEIIEISKRPDLLHQAVNFFWKCWGSDDNFSFYEDCILHSFDVKNKLPKFNIGLIDDSIIGSYALLTNDLISRQDLMPWFACLFVIEAERNKGYAGQLLQHGREQAEEKGFHHIYLSTDLVDFYEKKGWSLLGEGYGVSGGVNKIYSHAISLG